MHSVASLPDIAPDIIIAGFRFCVRAGLVFRAAFTLVVACLEQPGGNEKGHCQHISPIVRGSIRVGWMGGNQCYSLARHGVDVAAVAQWDIPVVTGSRGTASIRDAGTRKLVADSLINTRLGSCATNSYQPIGHIGRVLRGLNVLIHCLASPFFFFGDLSLVHDKWRGESRG